MANIIWIWISMCDLEIMVRILMAFDCALHLYLH